MGPQLPKEKVAESDRGSTGRRGGDSRGQGQPGQSSEAEGSSRRQCASGHKTGSGKEAGEEQGLAACREPGGGRRPSLTHPTPQEPACLGVPASPKIPGSLWVCGSSLVLFGCLLFRGLRARGVRPGLGLALKNVTMKGWRERGARCPSSPARPGSTLSPETESREGRSWVPALPQMHLEAKGQVPPPAQPRFPHLQP